LVPPRGFAYETVQFGGVRGKGVKTLAVLPFKLLRAFWQSLCVVRRVKPDVVVGLGGYITFPAGLMAVLCGKPLVLHEQNSVAGMANKVLSSVADRVFAGLVAQGVGIWMGFQSFINMGVNLGALPTKGLTLPLMSYGGSAILLNLIAIAVVLRVDFENRVVMHGGRL
jgi:UDP-N-acetylglucosamine--N-acetylmuramyl-(pentapeptide) pyrophosphoryl-undecaprenol N-acetylglucosamine transferase